MYVCIYISLSLYIYIYIYEVRDVLLAELGVHGHRERVVFLVIVYIYY